MTCSFSSCPPDGTTYFREFVKGGGSGGPSPALPLSIFHSLFRCRRRHIIPRITKAMSKKRQIDLELNYISKKQKELDEQMETLKKNRVACEDSSESPYSSEDDSDLEDGEETTTERKLLFTIFYLRTNLRDQSGSPNKSFLAFCFEPLIRLGEPGQVSK